MEEGKERIIMAGFRPPSDRKRLIDRKKVTDENEKINYKKLVEEVDKLGEILMKQSRIIDRLRE